MESNKQDSLQEKLDLLDKLRFSPSKPRKRKDNPIEVKYETSDSGSYLKKEEIKNDKLKFDKNNKRNFQYIYEKIKEMRKDMSAAIDKYGCQISPDPTASKDTRDFQLLISLVISVQNRDESTSAAMTRLKNFGLDVDNIHKASEEKILEVLGGVNLNKSKAKNIKKIAEMMVEKYDKKVPVSWDELVKFPGVGNKIAILFLNIAHGIFVGIGVDTHVHRVSNRLGWAHSKTPDETRIELESFVPKQEWPHINHWMVGFGQQICLPINPKCKECLLNNICPEGKKRMQDLKDLAVGIVKIEETEVKVITKRVKKNNDSIEVKEEITQISVKEEDSVSQKVKIEPYEDDNKNDITADSPQEKYKDNRKKVNKRQNTL